MTMFKGLCRSLGLTAAVVLVFAAFGCGSDATPTDAGNSNQRSNVMVAPTPTSPASTPRPYERYRGAVKRAMAAKEKYEDLLWRQPNLLSVGVGLFEDEHGKLTETVGIVIGVSEKVDQSTLAPEDRIPETLDGVPVQIIETYEFVS